MNRVYSLELHQVQNQVIEVGSVMYVEIDGTVEYAIMTMQVNGPHTDVQFLGDGIGNYGVFILLIVVPLYSRVVTSMEALCPTMNLF